MNMFTEEFLEECAEHLVKADEIQSNKDLMKELEPYMKELSARTAKVADAKTFWKKSLEDAVNKEDEEKEMKLGEKMQKVKGERALAKEEPKIASKS
jgi:hypothetical protein